jgi:uncharacterized protein with PIN domain
VCNSVLEPISHDQAAQLVPPHVLRTQLEFRRCPGCGRVYWPGSHLQAIRAQLNAFTPEEKDA